MRTLRHLAVAILFSTSVVPASAQPLTAAGQPAQLDVRRAGDQSLRITLKPVTFSAWEAGRSRPHDITEIAQTIERVFGVPAAWTLGVLEPAPERRRSEVPEPRFRRRWTDAVYGMNPATA